LSSTAEQHLFITGGAGFIGSWLAEYALSQGARVTAMDDLSTGLARNLKRCLKHPRFRFVEASVMDQETLGRWAGKATHIAHLASPVGVDHVLSLGPEAGEKLTRKMEEVTQHLLDVSRDYGASFFLASSSEVYVRPKGISQPQRFSEEQPMNLPSGSRWWYARMKGRLEELILNTRQPLPENQSWTIGRLFNVTGPRQRAEYGMVLPAFMASAAAGESLTIYGDGSQVRSFSHVFDVVQTIWELLNYQTDRPQLLNIGRYEPISMNRLAQEVIDHWADRALEVQHETRREQEVQYRAPDITRLQALPVHRPKRSIREIIRDMKRYHYTAQTVDPFELEEDPVIRKAL
jgi:UDP-glucose 4-epimerase